MDITMSDADITGLQTHFDVVVGKLFTGIDDCNKSIATGNNDRAKLRTDVQVLATNVGHLAKGHTDLKTSVEIHMKNEEGLRNKILFGVIGFLAVIVVSLIGYIWKVHVGT